MARKDIIGMSREEVKRLDLVQKTIGRGIGQGKVAEMLGISDRQVRRLVKAVQEKGARGIVHQLRGKESNRKYEAGFKTEILKVYHRKYEGFGPTFAMEKMTEKEGMVVSAETLRLWLREEGQRYEWERRGREHRRWRERKWYFGEMVQMDGSRHDWLEGRGPWLVLMAYIDDATGKVYGRFYDYEGTKPAMDSFRRYIRKYGIPQSLYADKHTTYQSWEKLTIQDELEGKEKADTQFGRAVKELGVKLIPAHSPQAKGRIERLFKTLQDRLVKEMRLRGIKTKEEANKFLDEGYWDRFNKKFSVIAKEQTDVHRKVGKGINLDRIFCIKERRRLSNDFTVVHDKKRYQIYSKVKTDTITVEERLDGSISLYWKDKRLKYRQIEALPRRKKEVKKPKVIVKDRAGKQWIPPKDHPWRRPFEKNILPRGI